MIDKSFEKYLLENRISEETIAEYIRMLRDFDYYLAKSDIEIDAIPQGKIVEYTEFLVEEDETSVLEFITALVNFATFIKMYDYIVEIIDIIESYNAMDNLFLRVAEKHGEEIRDKIFKDISIPPLGIHPEKKPPTTVEIMNRMEDILGEEKTVELLSPCLHGGPVEQAKKDREDFLKIKDIDKFLELKKQAFIERLIKHKNEGTLEFAQYVDDEVIEYAKNSSTISPGIRKGDKIIVTKIPYQIKKMITADEKKMKQYYSCYCSWVRGALKEGKAEEISFNFCNCSAGFFKQYWDIIFDQPIKVTPIETPLNGGVECKFAVQIPRKFQKK